MAGQGTAGPPRSAAACPRPMLVTRELDGPRAEALRHLVEVVRHVPPEGRGRSVRSAATSHQGAESWDGSSPSHHSSPSHSASLQPGSGSRRRRSTSSSPRTGRIRSSEPAPRPRAFASSRSPLSRASRALVSGRMARGWPASASADDGELRFRDGGHTRGTTAPLNKAREVHAYGSQRLGPGERATPGAPQLQLLRALRVCLGGKWLRQGCVWFRPRCLDGVGQALDMVPVRAGNKVAVQVHGDLDAGVPELPRYVGDGHTTAQHLESVLALCRAPRRRAPWTPRAQQNASAANRECRWQHRSRAQRVSGRLARTLAL